MIWEHLHNIQLHICNIYLENSLFIPLAIHVCFLPQILSHSSLERYTDSELEEDKGQVMTITCLQNLYFKTSVYKEMKAANSSMIFIFW